MNKLTIPTILVAVIMVAGIFAFVPVGQAATVHDSLLNEVQALGDAICSEDNDGNINSADANLATGVCEAVEV